VKSLKPTEEATFKLRVKGSMPVFKELENSCKINIPAKT
jgi:hypothetical protein